jgi:uncharacterized membrane protein YedE/YeeE
MLALAALFAGVMFGLGLAVSGMTNPEKVLGFLDVAGMSTGAWDPTLAVVLGFALVPMALAYRVRALRQRPMLGGTFQIPTRTDIDVRLLAGAAIFGAGWGLAGLCPGPAIAGLALAGAALPSLLVFGVSMLVGVVLSRRLV